MSTAQTIMRLTRVEGELSAARRDLHRARRRNQYHLRTIAGLRAAMAERQMTGYTASEVQGIIEGHAGDIAVANSAIAGLRTELDNARDQLAHVRSMATIDKAGCFVLGVIFCAFLVVVFM